MILAGNLGYRHTIPVKLVWSKKERFPFFPQEIARFRMYTGRITFWLAMGM